MQYSQKLFSINQTRKIEKHLIKEQNIPEFNLMLEAGKAVFNVLKKHITNKETPIFILCGPGNNGGDGYITASLAAKEDFNITCLEIGDFSKQSKVSKKAKALATNNNATIRPYNKNISFSKECVIIDGILGIGIKGKVRIKESNLIEKVNNSKAFIISIDNPSGLDCDSGDILGIAIKSNITVTFLSYKQGLYLKYGPKLSGKIEFSNLKTNYIKFLGSLTAKYHIIPNQNLDNIIPKRKIDDHKGVFGNILIVGGNYNMGGAVIMTALAACKAGAGKVTVLTRKEHISPLISRIPNVMTITYESEKDLEDAIEDKTLLAIGPGLGKSKWSKKLFDFFMQSNLPKVIDADALNLLSESKEKFNLSNAILTPHPKEAARLIGNDVIEIQKDRNSSIRKIQEKYGAITILKGANSLILNNKKELYLCPHGSPAMAVAGMGDILTGLISGLATQNITLNEAAILGVYFHALKANQITKKYGEIGMLPTDIL